MIFHSLFTTACIAILVVVAQQLNGFNPVTGDFLGAISLRCAVILGAYHGFQAFVRQTSVTTWLTIVTSSVGFTCWWKFVVSSGEYRITISPWAFLVVELGLTAILTVMISFFDQTTRHVFAKK